MSIRALVGACAVAAVASSTLADADLGVIGVSLDFPPAPGEFSEPPFRRLVGQSVFFSQRTNSGSTGGQLDGVTSFDSQNAVHEISFGEAFPEPNLTDYLRFGYFGVVETVEIGSEGQEIITDRSLVVATQFDYAQGLRVDDIFGVSEATLVNALTSSFDSPEFFSALDVASNNPNLSGVTGLTLAGVSQIRQGDSLTLYAFYPDPSNDFVESGSDIGFIDHSMIRVPTPSVALLLALGVLPLARRRR